MFALTSATGKLGSAVLNAILDNALISPEELVICTSSDPQDQRLKYLRNKNITIRHANFDDAASLEKGYAGCDKLFLVSTPRISMDFNDAPLWKGREAHHRVAIDAARKVGVKHIYYTSLAFGNPSKSSVMKAHIRTEAYLRELTDVKWTVIREGLYHESWPLYFGYYHALKDDERKEIVVAGDGPISWTSIRDMAFGTAKILAAPSQEWSGRTVYLSQNKTWSLQDIAGIVSKIRNKDVKLKVVSKEEYQRYYVEERQLEKASVEWWSATYDALPDGECDIKDSTLEDILRQVGKTPDPLEETIKKSLE
ncbi:NAD(P)-binding protein [Aaosphaeria arxii CBS 175.79]|uniref:NAD(P)-binding protein n=1 Tax=Aaosphaeria arxii CBS 175.79 TaxID=1450172 RepID=A0A6A5XXA7_9PLEO|nr:NAD(P)-binding protein [Aaosphaeria arxii CBS 175.79]KAF2017467.1 NAD(P)-binding protein [Aaosphaeria arxii CBS 175.79]